MLVLGESYWMNVQRYNFLPTSARNQQYFSIISVLFHYTLHSTLYTLHYTPYQLRVHNGFILCGYYEISIWLLYDSYPLLISLVWYLIIGDCNNSDRTSRKSRNWLSAIREIRYLRYLLFWFSTIKNQELNKTIDISADTFSDMLIPPQKSAGIYFKMLFPWKSILHS